MIASSGELIKHCDVFDDGTKEWWRYIWSTSFQSCSEVPHSSHSGHLLFNRLINGIRVCLIKCHEVHSQRLYSDQRTMLQYVFKVQTVIDHLNKDVNNKRIGQVFTEAKLRPIKQPMYFKVRLVLSVQLQKSLRTNKVVNWDRSLINHQ